MSNVEDPTAGGDAPVAETIKADRADSTISQSTIECADVSVASEDAVASEEVVATAAETESSAKVTSGANAPGGGIEGTDLDTRAAKTIDAIAEIAGTEDTVQADAQRSAADVESSTAVAPQNEKTPEKSVNEERADDSRQNARGNNATCISRLEAEVRKRTKERDGYQKKLEDTETKLAALQVSYDAITSHGGDEDTLQRSVEQLRGQLAQTALMYEERNRVVANQENQINALNNQVTSLKEVVSITRDLLQIRNIEVKQLQAEVDNMEKKITEERDRHNTMISKMDAAMRLNADLKKEYETQLSLFQSLREKYGEKITLLSAEKRALETAASAPE